MREKVHFTASPHIEVGEAYVCGEIYTAPGGRYLRHGFSFTLENLSKEEYIACTECMRHPVYQMWLLGQTDL